MFASDGAVEFYVFAPTFGIKYVNAGAYNCYKQAYVMFKASLVQFPD